MFERFKVHLVEDWQCAHKWSSVRLHLVAIALNALFAAMPSLDPAIAGMLPKVFQSPVIGVYAIVALVLRLTRMRSGA
jgi:hypothetical protein